MLLIETYKTIARVASTLKPAALSDKERDSVKDLTSTRL